MPRKSAKELSPQQKVFLQNLGIAIDKAGTQSALASKLRVTDLTITNWKKSPPKKIDGRNRTGMTGLASFLGLPGPRAVLETAADEFVTQAAPREDKALAFVTTRLRRVLDSDLADDFVEEILELPGAIEILDKYA